MSGASRQRVKTHPMAVKISLQAVIIIILSVGLTYIIPPSQAARGKITILQKIQIFDQIDTIALQRDKSIHTSGNEYDKYQDRLFHIAENAFKTEPDIETKYKYAKELNSIIQERGEYMYKNQKINNDGYAAFQQLEDKFTQAQ